jgi:hypothetical protein
MVNGSGKGSLITVYVPAGALIMVNDSRNRNDILANALEGKDLGSHTGNRVRGFSSCSTTAMVQD